jgi:RNase P/RNase MRP subunit p30
LVERGVKNVPERVVGRVILSDGGGEKILEVSFERRSLDTLSIQDVLNSGGGLKEYKSKKIRSNGVSCAWESRLGVISMTRTHE